MDSATVHAELLARLESWWKCYNNGDIRSVADMFMEDCILMPNGHAPLNGREAVFATLSRQREALGKDAKPLDCQLEETEPLGPDTAFSSSRGRMDTFNITSVIIWKKIAGEWMIYRDIYNNYPAQP